MKTRLEFKYNEGLKNTLRILRSINDIKASDAASYVGVSHAHILRLENGQKRPTVELLEKLADIYRIDPEKILEFATIAQREELNRYETIRLISEYYVFENPKTVSSNDSYIKKIGQKVINSTNAN